MGFHLMQMAGFIIKKAAGAAVVLIGVSIIAFLLSVFSPGDPAYLILVADGTAEPTQMEISEMRENLGLNDPIHIQYKKWLAGALHGDIGRSFVTGKRITDEMAMRLPYTVKLALLSILVSTLAGLALGLLMVSGQNQLGDRVGQIIGLAFISVPDFWFAIILIGIFSEMLRILPTSGAGTPVHYILPSVVMAAGSIGSISRLSRTVLLNELNKDYILTARSKGITEKKILIRHALANALIPITTSIGLNFGHMLGGAIIVESIFAIPGIGQYAMNGIYNRDYPVIQGFVIYTTVLFIAVNFILDMVYLMINPRLRLKGASN
jgi:peptide/nickel transport system permease protein